MVNFNEPAWMEPLLHCIEQLRERAAEVDRQGRYPYESMKIVHEHGLLQAVAPASMGGYDLGPHGDMWGYFRMLDLLAAGCGSTAQLVAVHFAAMATVKAIGTPEQLEKFATAAREDGSVFCYLGSEPTQRFTVSGGRPRYDAHAGRVDGGWIINADKFFATGSVGSRFVMALSMAEGAPDMTGLLVPVLDRDDPAVDVQDTWDNMGQRATTSGVCRIKNAFVPDAMTIGAPGEFLKPRTLGPLFQLTFATLFNGMAQAALDFTRHYMLNHATPPVGLERAVDEPHVPTLIGEMSVRIEAGRALVRRAAEMLTGLERDQVSLPDASIAVYQAKCHGSKFSVELGSTLFRLCGARATSRKYNADMYWRNARTLTLHDNLDRQHLAIGRAVLGIADSSSFTR